MSLSQTWVFPWRAYAWKQIANPNPDSFQLKFNSILLGKPGNQTDLSELTLFSPIIAITLRSASEEAHTDQFCSFWQGFSRSPWSSALTMRSAAARIETCWAIRISISTVACIWLTGTDSCGVTTVGWVFGHVTQTLLSEVMMQIFIYPNLSLSTLRMMVHHGNCSRDGAWEHQCVWSTLQIAVQWRIVGF